MNSIAVTIIIPIYNGQSVLVNAVNDVFSQDYPNIELITVNDGSNDDSLALLNELATKAPKHVRMIIISKENAGICEARNSAISNATGDFIAFMDQDDRIPSDYITNLIEAADENTNVVIGGTIDFYPSSGKKNNRDLNPDAEWSMYRNTAPWGRVFRSSLLKEYDIRFTPTKISEDFYFNFLYLSYCRCGQVKVIPQSGYMWTIDDKSESHQNMSRISNDRDITVILTKLLTDMKNIEADSVLSKDMFEYLIIKHIVWYMLFVCKTASKGDIKPTYEHVMIWLKNAFPNYRKNPQLKAGRPVGETFRIRFIVRLCVLLDKMGLLLTTLKLYNAFP